MGMSIMYGIAKKRTIKAVRNRFLKITETYTLSINDFAGKNVSQERFCDRVFGPEAYLEQDEHSRKHHRLIFIVMSILVIVVTALVSYVAFSN